MNKVLYLITLLILCGCTDPSYEITQDGIKRDKPIQNGFDLIEIVVTEFNKEGRPLKYTDRESVFCGPTNRFPRYRIKSAYGKKDKEIVFKAQKIIKFFEISKNYKWVFTKKGSTDLKFHDYSNDAYDKLPMELKKNQWYLLNFSNASNIVDKVFFMIKEDGKIEQYDYYKVIFGV
ncbi:hypothetical protein UMM65_12850 [Aureibaculum sp. 2210JD6-5]|uniref:hypothetical protein n=1 Tax=Aureibaculum sp. 2210JD6-5 TaxID=3103957 RepID=UPI002AAECAE1|nr:hypothetical protein [Aureibaculum sp. 2210JD6-5]MDY7396132.1 hypothetical protein [Aureibaculum sp. 2210JD6-5]